MSHLSAERLAALADPGAAPTETEVEHLARCSLCADEQLAYVALVTGARAERDALGVPLTRWDALSNALQAEGLVAGTRFDGRAVATSTERVLLPGRPAFAISRRMLQAAAAVVLLVGGVVAGRATAVAGPLAVARSDFRAPAATPAAGTGGEVAALPAGFAGDYASVEDARAALERLEIAYQHTAAFLAERDSTTRLDAPDGYRARLAALERAGRTMREAMEEAPYDPVLTGYYLTTLGQREATLRQLNVAVPADARLNSF